jgi:hypothetical protein
MTGNREGDACATSVENSGLCGADGGSVLQCREGTLLKTGDCRSCAISGTTVECIPP